jgi:SAM-dependent methyltransferase
MTTHPTLPADLDERLAGLRDGYRPWLASLQPKPRYVRALEKSYALDVCPRLDYDVLADTFASRYFMPNVSKAATAFAWRPPRMFPRQVVDLGCGSGAASVALLTQLDSADPQPRPRSVHLTLIDVSRRQLELARRAVEVCAQRLRHVRVTADYERHDINDPRVLEPVLPTADLVVMSHVLTELGNRAAAVLTDVVDLASSGCEVVVLERPDDVVWGDVERVAAATCEAVETCSLVATARGSEPSHASGTRSLQLRPGWPVRRMTIDIAPDRRLPRLVRAYVHAWEARDPALLDDVFSLGAEYHERPFQEPFVGLDAIRDYWRRTVVVQQSPRVSVVPVAYTPTTAALEWVARFGAGGREKVVRGAMFLTLDLERRRIGQLREYFVSSTSGGRGMPAQRESDAP